MNPRGVSIIIATWNGKTFLQKNLPPLFHALSCYDGPYEVIVVEDAGTDDTDRFISENYPQILFRRLQTNIGNGQALNRGAEMAHHEILYFLDNDVEVTSEFLTPVIRHFDDPFVFGVGSRSIERPSKPPGPLQLPRVKFRYGIFWYYYETLIQEADLPVPALFASAGHCAVSKEKFFSLGGFDPLYGRFYLEDLDLCYRAWKKGWKVMIEPESKVYHEAAGTIRKILSRREIERRQWRNRFLFTWKNIHTTCLLLQHVVFLPPELFFSPFFGKSSFSLGFLDALFHFKESLRKRTMAKKEALLSDCDVLEKVGPLSRYEKNIN